MKKTLHILPLGLITILTLCFTISFSGHSAKAKPGDSYSPEQAIAYADSCFVKKGKSYKVRYNKKYGKDLCAGYVSQCLCEGGLPMDDVWYWKSKKKSSLTWRVSKMLFSYLKKSGYKVIHSPDASQIKPGDIIFYWTNGGWGHCSICVAKTKDGTPRINAFNDPHYHFSYWTLGYKTCVISMESKTDTPVLSQTPVNGGKRITLSCSTKGASIYYTLNGTIPTTASPKYTKPFIVSKNTKINAIAAYGSYENSNMLSMYIDTKKMLDNGIYYIHTSTSQNKVLGIPNNSSQENTSIQLVDSNAEHNRKFSVTYKGNGCYTLSLLHSGQGLTESAADKDKNKKGIPVQKKLTGDSLGLWKITYNTSGGFRITNAKTSRHLSIGNKIQTGIFAYTTANTEAKGQAWNFKKTSRSMLKLEHCVAPDNIKKKSGFVFSGTISSNYPIQKVTVSIINSKGKTVTSASAAPKAKNYSIRNLSNKIFFGKLSTGTYHFRITASDSTKQEKMLIDKTFRVKKK